MNYGIKEDLTDEYILKYVSQKEIFEYFLNIPVVVGEMFCSPLRRDKHPTCTFSWANGKLWYRDWAESRHKDCFNIVEEIYNCGFYEAIQIIYREMIKEKPSLKPRTNSDYKKNTRSKNRKSIIRVKFSRWRKEVIDYLTSYEITSKQCEKFNIRPIEKVWINNKLNWNYRKKDPALGYYFGKSDNGEERWKIYFFKRDNYRFIGNTNRINGWIQLPEEGRDLIITKSLKDVVCLDSLGYPSIAMQNETTIPYQDIIKQLMSRFENIYSFYDFDYTGIINAQKLKRMYNISPIFLTNGKFNTYNYGSKDISDFIQKNNLGQASYFLQNCIQQKRR